MSDNWLKFVPTDPHFQPTADAAEAAATILRAVVPIAMVSFEFRDPITFFDPGSNWSGVECPRCGADAEPWWSDAMTAAHEGAFRDLLVVAPCCGAKISLNELHYPWPAAFGRFVLEAMNPGVPDIAPEQEVQLAECLGCTLRKLWVQV